MVPEALSGDHHVGLVQHKHADFLEVDHLVLGAPVQECSRRSDDDLLLQLDASLHCSRQAEDQTSTMARTFEVRSDGALTPVPSDGVSHFHIQAELPHLLDDLTDLQSQLVRWSDAEAL